MDENETVIDDTSSVEVPATETAEQKTIRLEELNKKLFERAKKAEADAKALKEKTNIIKEQEIPKPSDILRSPEFRLHREGYNEDEIEIIMNNGGPSILENKTSPITLGIQASREQRKAEDAAALALGASGLSEIERKYTEQDLRNMKKEDLEKLLPHTDN